jgi:predicted kinase
MKDSKKNRLILTVGLPYSGKTQWAISQNQWPIVNPDSIRLAATGTRYYQDFEPMVWAMAKIFVGSLFLAGHTTVIVDATNNTEKRRDFWREDLWVRRFVVMDISAECCVARAQKNNDQVILPVIERMAEAQEYNGIYYGDGYRFAIKDPLSPAPFKGDQELMVGHIQRPDGITDTQIYHNGYSLDI